MFEKNKPVSASESLKNSILIAHPGTQHSQQTAAALQKYGLLKKYYTGYYFRDDSLLAKCLQFLPGELQKIIHSQLTRRRRAEIASDKVESLQLFDLPAILLARFFHTGKLFNLFRKAHMSSFNKYVGRQITKARPKIFWGYEGSAKGFFETCNQLGIFKVLDHTTGSVFAAKEIYAREKARFPELAVCFGKKFDDDYYYRHQRELELADAIIVPSDYTLNNLLRQNVPAEKIYKVPYGADFTLFKSAPCEKKAEGPIRLLYAGVVSQHKGIMYLLEAVKEIKDVQLILVGHCNLPESVLKNLGNNISVPGFKASEELAQLYQQADIFVFPAIHEGSSIVVYEAMASGLPVITTPNAGSIIKHLEDGIIVEPFSSSALTTAIKKLQASKSLREKIGKNGQRKLQDFSWNHYHDRIKKVIEEFYFCDRQKM